MPLQPLELLLWVLTQAGMHVISCLSFLPPHYTARLLFWRLVTGLWSLPSPLSPCLAGAAGQPGLCPASPGGSGEQGEHPGGTALCCRGFKGSSKGRGWPQLGRHSLLSHATNTAPTLTKKLCFSISVQVFEPFRHPWTKHTSHRHALADPRESFAWASAF